MSDRLFVGIDGGGTRSTAVALDSRGRERARLAGGPALVRSGEPTAGAERLARLCADVVRAAGGTPPIAALCCALAGAGRHAERAALRDALRDAGCARVVRVTGDGEAALRDAFGAGAGVLVVAGTGSIACGRNAEGDVQRCGGWGALLGDEGSAYAIGVAALRAVVRAADGRGEPTLLTAAIAAAAGVPVPDGLVAWADAATKAEIAALAPRVTGAAEQRDAVAGAILDAAAAALADHVPPLVERLGLGAGGARVDVAFAGGALRVGSPLRRRLAATLRRADPRLRLLARAPDAAIGAARLARDAAGPHAGTD